LRGFVDLVDEAMRLGWTFTCSFLGGSGFDIGRSDLNTRKAAGEDVWPEDKALPKVSSEMLLGFSNEEIFIILGGMKRIDR
jgi:hypothetical protein